MVRLFTDHPGYFNDLADELRLFSGRDDVIPCGDTDWDASATLRTENGRWYALGRIRADGKLVCCEYEHEEVTGAPLVVKRYEKRVMKIALFRAMTRLTGTVPPWGSLTGIRPTRLFRELAIADGEEEAYRLFTSEFDVSGVKADIARSIFHVQDPIITSLAPNDADVYIHIPFCLTKCLYCSFPSQVRTKKTDMRFYIDALKKDISLGAEILKNAGRRLRAVYVGGGTPTVLEAGELSEVLETAIDAYGGTGIEFTVEAGRPDTITPEKLMIMKSAGVTRISINPQTMVDRTLKLIGRSHSAEDVIRAFEDARRAGFDNINMDVIAGLPGEGTDDMEYTLDRLVAMSPENITVHTLALKRTSRLVTEKETYPMPDAATVERMVMLGAEKTAAIGMRPYYMYRQKYMSGNLENVGYAKPGYDCVYNVDMMEDIASIMSNGAGSMTKCVYDAERRVERVPSPKDIATYAEKIEELAKKKAKLFE